jgi:hypothetical protein
MSQGVNFPFAPGMTTMEFLPWDSTVIRATPEGVWEVTLTA